MPVLPAPLPSVLVGGMLRPPRVAPPPQNAAMCASSNPPSRPGRFKLRAGMASGVVRRGGLRPGVGVAREARGVVAHGDTRTAALGQWIADGREGHPTLAATVTKVLLFHAAMLKVPVLGVVASSYRLWVARFAHHGASHRRVQRGRMREARVDRRAVITCGGSIIIFQHFSLLARGCDCVASACSREMGILPLVEVVAASASAFGLEKPRSSRSFCWRCTNVKRGWPDILAHPPRRHTLGSSVIQRPSTDHSTN